MNQKPNPPTPFPAREGGRTLGPLPETERGLLISALAPTHSSARDSNPWLIAKVLSRGLNASSTRISVHKAWTLSISPEFKLRAGESDLLRMVQERS